VRFFFISTAFGCIFIVTERDLDKPFWRASGDSLGATFQLAAHRDFLAYICRPKDDTGLIHSSLCGFLCCSPRLRQPQKMPFANENMIRVKNIFGEWIEREREKETARRQVVLKTCTKYRIEFQSRS
jgi:hypothetical protein